MPNASPFPQRYKRISENDILVVIGKKENIRKFALQISVPNPYWRETFDKIVSIKALMIELLT